MSDFAVGDRVVSQSVKGAYAEQTIVTAADPRAVPKSLGAVMFEVERGSVRGIP